MASLKDLRLRIRSVQSTRKITSAMKMVAAANLRRAQDAAEAARPYAERMQRMIATLASRVGESAGAPELLVGREVVKTHLVVVATADRGLCGGFNTNLVKEARHLINKLEADGVTVKILCVGRKGRDQLRRDHASKIVDSVELAGKKRIAYADADAIAEKVRRLFLAGDVDAATLIYARFKSAMTQFYSRKQLIPAPIPEIAATESSGVEAVVEFEPDEETVLANILPRNLSVQIYGALLENAASEHGSRMTAMDSATRNAGDLIKKLNITYNRQRQATITKELIEIISGAEAL